MDVEYRSGQLYNSEISASFVGLPISNNRHMNQFLSQKAKLQKQKKSHRHPNKQHPLKTPNLEVLPKIETMTSVINPKSQSSNNNSSSVTDKFVIDLPMSEAFSTNNVEEWLKMPSKSDNTTNTHNQHHSHLSTVSSDSEDMLTRVGEFTDRTSVTSSEWGDDVCEFDKKESHRVNQMFEEIEWMLFNDGTPSSRSESTKANQLSSFSDRSGINSGPVHLRHECSEWTHQFPHFRLIGHQVSLPQEQGFMFHESDLSASATPKNSPRILITNSSTDPYFVAPKSITDTSDFDKMSLVGSGIRLGKIDNDMSSSEEGGLLSSQEEVFAADGEIVEIIAIDYKMDDEDFNIVNQKISRPHNSLFQFHKGYPPITPNAVMRDAVLTAVFDNLWSQVVEWVLPLISKIYQSCSSREILAIESSESNPSVNMIISDLYGGQKPFSQISATSLSSLDNILKISSKTLQFREKSYLQSIPEQTPNQNSSTKGITNMGIGTSRNPLTLLLSYPRKQNKILSTLDRSQTPLSNHESSFILDKDYKRTSLINPSHFPNSFNSEHLSPLRCLRGKALYSCQSPDMISRCGTLPPINSRYQLGTHSRLTGSRIGSANAQNNHTQNISIGSTNHLLMTSEFSNTRPCTSQTARSDQPGGHRSITPNGNRRSLNLNVHGSSIAMNSFTVKGSEELAYENLKQTSKPKPSYWKIYSNQVTTSSKRNKSLSNSVK